MMLYKKIIAMLLVLTLLLGFAACKTDSGNEGSMDGSSEEAVSSEESSESPQERAAALYKAAEEAIAQNKDLKLSITAVTTRTYGTNVFKLEQEISALYKGINTDALTAHVSEKNISGSDLWRVDKYFADGKYTYMAHEAEDFYYSEMTADTFLEIQNVVGFDAELYNSIGFDGDDESTIVLSDASAVEEWVAPDYAKVLAAEGKVKLDENGQIKQYVYTASYTQGPASYDVEYTMDVSAPEAGDEISLPEGEGIKLEGDSIFLPDVFELVYAATKNMMAFEMQTNSQIYSQAGGIAVNMSENTYAYGTNSKDFIAKVLSEGEAYYPDGTTREIDLEENYKDGKITYEENGETMTVTMSAQEILDYYYEDEMNLKLFKPDVTLFESCEINDLVEYWHISYKLTEEGNKLWEDYVGEYFYGDPSLVDNEASAYTADKAEGYISIDLDTLLLTAAGFEYEGTHTVDGTDYVTGLSQSVAFASANVETYKEITGELPEEPEAESTPTPVFYKVTAPNGGVMYVLGTIHIGDSGTANLPDEVYQALENADALAVEFDIIAFEEQMDTDENLEAEISNNYYYSDDTKISDHLDEELYEAGRQHALTAGVPSYAADYLTPASWSEFITNLYTNSYLDLSYEYGVDNRLLRLAKEKGIEIINVEDPKDQYGMASQYTDAIHKVLLMDALSVSRLAYMEQMQEMYDLWCEGDEQKLIDYIRSEEEPEGFTEEELKAIEEYEAILGADRDEKMIEKAKGYMESGKTVFFAVGLAHILDETGLVDALRADGYTVELVEYGK